MENTMEKTNDRPLLRARPEALSRLSNTEELEAVLRESDKHFVLIFTHSRTCPLSESALHHLIRYLEISKGPISYLITVQTDPKTCEGVTQLLGVRHETPQAILVVGRRAVWHASHHDITVDAFATAARVWVGNSNEQRRSISPETEDSSIHRTMKSAEDICRGWVTRSNDDPNRKEEPDEDDDDEAPETPLDEPAPTPVQDPPAEPDPHPYTVQPSQRRVYDLSMSG
jgi:bacillithiol system protein YtxJ